MVSHQPPSGSLPERRRGEQTRKFRKIISITTKASNPGMVTYQAFVGSAGRGWDIPAPSFDTGSWLLTKASVETLRARFALKGEFRGGRGSYLPPVPTKPKTRKTTQGKAYVWEVSRGSLGRNGFGLLIRRTARTKGERNKHVNPGLPVVWNFFFAQRQTNIFMEMRVATLRSTSCRASGPPCRTPPRHWSARLFRTEVALRQRRTDGGS